MPLQAGVYIYIYRERERCIYIYIYIYLYISLYKQVYYISETCKHPPAKHPPAEMENAHIPPGSKTPPKTRANAPRDNTTNSRPTLCSGGHPPPSRRGRRARRPGPRTAQAACPPPQASRKHSNAQARPVHAEPPPARPPPTHSNDPNSACAKTQILCWPCGGGGSPDHSSLD